MTDEKNELINIETILLVEDNPEFRETALAYLEGQGVKVVVAKNYDEAMNILDKCMKAKKIN